jgi:hypothetical protein
MNSGAKIAQNVAEDETSVAWRGQHIAHMYLACETSIDHGAQRPVNQQVPLCKF